MFDNKSRYAKLDTTTLTTAEGRTIQYVKRRFLPRGADLDLLVELKPEDGDRLDLISWRTLGNAEVYWRICDASDAMNPADLLDEESTIRVPLPSVS